jgi:hypothetical protein
MGERNKNTALLVFYRTCSADSIYRNFLLNKQAHLKTAQFADIA